jgi:hypothetical protein
MAIDPVLEQLLNDAGLSGAERDDALAAFSNEKLGKTLKQATLRQSDYSRKMDELQTNWKKANEEYLRMQTDFGTTQTERDEAKAKLAETEAKLATAQTTPQIDTTKFFTREEVEARERTMASSQMSWMGDVLEGANEYEQLFGKKISHKTLMQEAMAAKKAPLDYLEETYKLSEKRAEKAAAEKVAYENTIREDERKKVTGEFLNPATRSLRESENPFWQSTAAEAKQPWDDTAPTAEETALVAALANAGR